MTPRGKIFLLKLDPTDSAIEIVRILDKEGLSLLGTLRKETLLYVWLASSTSTQRVSDIVGPGISVSLGNPVADNPPPPGSDWFIRAVGNVHRTEECQSALLGKLENLSNEVPGLDLVRMDHNPGQPAALDFRLSTERHTPLIEKRPDFLDMAERHDLGMISQPLSLFKKGKKLACFDLDSTLVAQELIVEVGKVAGKKEQVEELTERSMSGELDYRRSFLQRVALLRGVTEEQLQDVWAKADTTEGVSQLLRRLRMGGMKTSIISGAFTFFTEKARQRLGMDHAIGNEVEIKDGRLTGTVRGKVIDREMKCRKMKELASDLGLTLDQVLAVGDGANDLSIIRKAGTGIAYDKGGMVERYADGVLPEGKLQDLPLLIGI